MNIAILNFGSQADCLLTTSLIKRLRYDNNKVSVATNEDNKKLFEFSGVKTTSIDLCKENRFDMLINLTPSYMCSQIAKQIDAKNKFGYFLNNDKIDFFNEAARRHYEAMYLHKETNSNVFQLIFSLAGLTWQGEGYGLKYYPKNKTNKRQTGLIINDNRLKQFLNSELTLEKTRLKQLKAKKDILQHLDEINKCKFIVTDDSKTFHCALALRKHVEYIIQQEFNYRIELFGSGHLHILK